MEDHLKKKKLRVEVLNVTEEREHFHQEIELLFVLEGSLDVTIGSNVTHMEAEDILVINANKKHSLRGSEDILFARLYITYQLVSDIFQSTDIIFWCDSTKENSDRYEELRDTLKKLLNHYLSTQGGVVNFGHIALCYQVMDILAVHFLVKAGDKNIDLDKNKFENRIFQINNYMRANYNQAISLSDLAEQLYLSEGYLSRFFKKNYGMNFAAYLSNIRLYHAVEDLLYTDQPVTRIAYDNGFASVTLFNKAFKNAYGETPSEFRKKSKDKVNKEEQDKNKQVIEQRLEEFLRNDGLHREKQKIQEDVRTEFSVQTQEETKTFWGDMINIGAAEDLLNSELREHLIYMKEALHFKYVRFWNIFSKEMLIDLYGEGENYNFSRLDSILDFLVKYELKPHIELGMKPKRLQKNVQDVLLLEGTEDKFPDKDRWREILTAMIKHMIHRYGRAEVSSWRIELWFKESLEWNRANIENYYKLFDDTCEIIHKYCDKVKIGGCGFLLDRIGHMEEEEFLSKWKNQKHFPDFLTFLYYGYERDSILQDGYSKRLTDSEGMLHRVSYIRKLITKIISEDYPIYITEWNLTISDRNYMNDTCFKGAYIVKNVLDCYGLCSGMALFQASDRTSEYYDSNEMLHGGTGIITKDMILKPAGFAFEFLNRLLPYYIGKKSNCLLTTDGHGNYGIICHNQKKLNYNYYLLPEDQVDKKNIWKYFEDRDSREIKIRLADVEDGIYQMKTYSINEQNGSVLDIWGELGYESELTRNDIKYFRRVCEPKLKIQKVEAKGGNLDINMTLAANEIAFIRLKWFA